MYVCLLACHSFELKYFCAIKCFCAGDSSQIFYLKRVCAFTLEGKFILNAEVVVSCELEVFTKDRRGLDIIK